MIEEHAILSIISSITKSLSFREAETRKYKLTHFYLVIKIYMYMYSGLKKTHYYLGWRMVLKVAAGGSIAPKSGIFTLWSDTGSMNEEVDGAASLTSGTTFKSSIIDQWTSLYIRAVL